LINYHVYVMKNEGRLVSIIVSYCRWQLQ